MQAFLCNTVVTHTTRDTFIIPKIFAYETATNGPPGISIRGTPLDRAVREVETMYASYGRPGPVCRARVNCATSFTQSGGKEMFAVGTDYGVFISAVGDPRGWNKV